MEKKIKEIKEIPFGAKDSELYKFEYTIPEGYEARIEDGKVIVKKKESEDEKIRKELLEEIEFIIPHDDETDSEGLILPSYHARIDRYKSYLEKQKDILEERAKNITTNMLEDGIEGIQRDLIEFLSNTVNASWIDIIQSADAYTERIRNIIEKQKEQKPAVEQLDGTFNSYDMAKTFTEGQNYVIAHPEKFGLCKPAEWGEEDAGMLNCIIATLCEESHGGREANEKMVTWLENRLKSLRPQPHWKPSMEQIEALKDAFRKDGGNEYRKVINSLYRDLEKLL